MLKQIQSPHKHGIKVVNEVSGQKTTNRCKLRAASERERLKLWKEHFQNLLENSLTKDRYVECNICKGWSFTVDELNIALKNKRNGKTWKIDIVYVEVWKLDGFSDIPLQLCNTSTSDVL